MEGLLQLLASGREAAHLLHPSEAALDGVSLPVSLGVEPRWTAALPTTSPELVLAVGDHRADASLAKIGADPVGAVALVAREALRSRAPSDPNGPQQRLQKEALVALSRAQDRRERRAEGVREEVDLRPEAASAVAEGLVAAPFLAPPAARFARMLVPSASHVP